jgi:hypothetical protein
MQVWGLFAPKFVFDVVGLVLTDVLICLASLLYSGRLEDDDTRGGFRKLNSKLLKSHKGLTTAHSIGIYMQG